MNLPNSITLSRIAAIPIFLWVMSPISPFRAPGHQEIVAVTIFILASITDGLDGYLARRRGQITTVGILLDPLADKLMISAAYIVLVGYVPGIVPAWIATLVIGREFLITGLRSIAAAEGFTIQASDVGKLKTVLQIVSVVAALLAHRWSYWNLGGFIVGVRLIAYTSIYWMTVVSMISAVDYFLAFWSKVNRASEVRRRPTFVAPAVGVAPAKRSSGIL